MSQNKKHIVIITTWFPPHQSVAVNRMVSFTRYLDHSKYDITVLTHRKKQVKKEDFVKGVKIFRIEGESWIKLPEFTQQTGKIKHYLKVIKKTFILRFLSSEITNWKKKAIQKLITINNSSPVDVVISSFAPVEPHLVAHQFKKIIPQSIWIADMRDEMSQNPQLTEFTKNKLFQVEKEIKGKIDALITVSQPILEQFKNEFIDVRHF